MVHNRWFKVVEPVLLTTNDQTDPVPRPNIFWVPMSERDVGTQHGTQRLGFLCYPMEGLVMKKATLH